MPVALVTGCSSGIGLATALHFAREKYEVRAGVRTPDTATELREAIERERLPAKIVTLDVDDPESVQAAVRESGTVDVLVNNAGIGGGGPIEDVPLDFAQSMFQTNYFGVIRMIQAVLPSMRRRRTGAIVNISSIGGRVAIAGHGHYCAVKHALEAPARRWPRRFRASASAWPSSSPAWSSLRSSRRPSGSATRRAPTPSTCGGCCSSTSSR